MIILIVIFTIGLEHFFIIMKEKKVSYFSYSAISTALGIILMMVAEHWWIYLVVIGLGLAQKHFLSIEKKHFFNPSNFALLFALLLFYNDAHIVLGQLGDSVWLKIFILILAIGILIRVERWVIPLVFIISYIIMQYVVIVQHDPVMIMEDVYHRFYSVSFLVFILFMLTDPRTTPQSIRGQAVFSIGLVFFSTLLDYWYGFRVQHLFMSLFFFSIMVPLSISWETNANPLVLFFTTFILLYLALSAIIYIETKPPYYFEMDG